MKSKKWATRLLVIFGILCVLVFYFILYFVPSIKNINISKRDLKDLDLKIEDFKRVGNLFSFSDETEKKVWAKTDQEFISRFFEIKKKGDNKKIYKDISTDIKKLARMEGISNLTIKSKESEIKNTKIKTKEFRSIVLKFRGDLKKSMNFINHIPWAAGYLTLNTLTIMEGDLYPNYMAVLNIQYLDPNQRNDFELLVDLDSEILLKKVYNNPPERHRKKELAPQFGKKVFRNE